MSRRTIVPSPDSLGAPAFAWAAIELHIVVNAGHLAATENHQSRLAPRNVSIT